MSTSTVVRNARYGAVTAALSLSLALAMGSPAVAQTPQPTLQFDRTCYTEHMEGSFTGTGYTPGGAVNLVFARPMDPRGAYATLADAAGSLNDRVGFPDADEFLREGEERQTIFVSATDQTRAEAGQQPPESQFAVTQFTFTRWAGYSPGRYVPGGQVGVELYGWAFAAGKTAWMQFRKGSRTVASVKVGRLDEECGDRAARVRVPRNIKPGRYRIVLSTKRRTLSDSYSWRAGRVTARRSRASAASDTVRSMSRMSLRSPGAVATTG
jgi:hypothetical protein